MNRRTFLQSAAVAAGALAMNPRVQAAVEPGDAGWIDAHVHVWSPDTKRWPLAEGYSPDDMKPPSFTPEELLAHARPCGVRRIVLIQMSFYRYDNAYMLDTIERFPGTFSGVGIVDQSAAAPQDAMRELKKRGVRGFRITAGTKPVDAWLDSPGMAAMWRTAAEENLAICPLVNPQYLPSIDRMCQRFPDTRVVIDHFARVGIDGEIRRAEIDALCRVARHKRVHVKTSAFYALGRKEMPYDDLAPMIRQVRDAYGAERLMWATDCPFQVQNGHTYEASIALVRDRLDFLSDDERRQLLRGAAERVFFN